MQGSTQVCFTGNAVTLETEDMVLHKHSRVFLGSDKILHQFVTIKKVALAKYFLIISFLLPPISQAVCDLG